MATSKEYMAFILDQLSLIDGISHRMMMGEYIIYIDGKIIAYVCDDRFLVKPTKTALKILPDAPLEPPYDGAKPMILVENVDDKQFLKGLFEKIALELPAPKKKK